MTRSLKTWICVATGLVFVLGTTSPVSAVEENPYQSIIDRNVFGVKPPPPPDPNAEEANKPPPPNITLTGIITLGGKRVLMETPPPPAKPGEQPKKGSFIMREGERDGEIEVISIDEVQGVVRVKNGGKEVSLNFKDNGPKMVSAAPVGPQPGLPGALPLARPAGGPPGVMPGGATPNPAAYPRTLRLPQLTGSAQPGATTSTAMPGYTSTGAMGSPATGTGAAGVPMPALGVPTGNATLTKWPPEQSDMTAEQQRAMIEVMRQKYAAEGNRAANLLPGGNNTTQPTPQNQQVPVPNQLPMPGPRMPGF